MLDEFKQQLPDVDAEETREWIESLDGVIAAAGPDRARFLLHKVLKRARMLRVGIPPLVQTRYINTISPEQEPAFPGDERLELRVRRMVRWNAVAMVVRANERFPGIGGHLSTYASSASLYEVGFNHFFRGKDAAGGGDQIFFQGHAAPGIYARAFLEGRLTESQLDRFRRETRRGEGLSSYPHPRLMPEFWEFPTVSMGLGPLNAIYQARFNRYLAQRGLRDTDGCRVWAFVGDGEMDEPEALGGLALAGREGLDNLTLVVNCNLQRLDGPVRGNGKIIQELEALFRGAGWNVIKVIWGREWDDLLARDVDGVLVNKMNDTLDGEFQRYSVESGAYIREHFFGPDPRLRAMVEHLSDEDLVRLRRGGHDYKKLYAAYKLAVEHRGAPTAILAKTVKGWTLGEGTEGRNITHQVKHLDAKELRTFRDRLELPIPDEALEDPPYYHPGPSSEEIKYLIDRRRALGGFVPRRVVRAKPPTLPDDQIYRELMEGTEAPAPGSVASAAPAAGARAAAAAPAATAAAREVSTTMAFGRLLRSLVRDPRIGRRIVPIIPDEARTFGLDALFREIKIYSAVGQRYEPVDSNLFLRYAEAKDGQILEEGITEAGAMASFTAAGTSYATHGEFAIPFFIFYSMFGFQRVGDMAWAFGDARGRGFLLGATAGRTTLSGEGLQHQDGHSHLLASAVPSCVAYDPAWSFELAAIVRDGLRRMIERGEDVFYYITLYNENYAMPAMPRGVEEGIVRGLYRFRAADDAAAGGARGAARGARGAAPRAQLLGSGSILRHALRAQEILAEEFGVHADVWSATSYTELRREALEVERWNRLHPLEPQRTPHVAQLLAEAPGPVVAASDFMKAVPDQIARWVPADGRGPRAFTSLGTDGFGHSDTRETLRRHFEIDAPSIVVAALSALAASGAIGADAVARAIRAFEIDVERPGFGEPASPASRDSDSARLDLPEEPV
jgi:pyruvate dehydrogenase E1 component